MRVAGARANPLLSCGRIGFADGFKVTPFLFTCNKKVPIPDLFNQILRFAVLRGADFPLRKAATVSGRGQFLFSLVIIGLLYI